MILCAAPLTKGHLFEANFVPLRNVIDGTKPSETFSLDEVMLILSFQPEKLQVRLVSRRVQLYFGDLCVSLERPEAVGTGRVNRYPSN